MPGLDDFYRYIERKEKQGEEPPVERVPVPAPGSQEMVKVQYVVRGGVTIAVPIDEPDPPLVASATETAQTALLLDVAPAPVKEATTPRVVVRSNFKIPNPKQVVEQLLIPPLPPQHPSTDAEGAMLWESLPRHVQVLAAMAPEAIAPSRTFEETRDQLIIRLLDPVLTLEETAKLLDVCPATVRRYANRGHLNHHRTLGQQRRFKLSDVMAFLDKRAAKQRRSV